jgi:hypothetical protein
MFSVLAFAVLSRAGASPVASAEGYAAELLPAFKNLDQAKLEELYAPSCIFGTPYAGEAGEQKDVLMKGLANDAWVTHPTKEFREAVKGIKVLAANQIEDPDQITAWMQIEAGKDTWYQWMVLQPSKKASNGWTCISVLLSPAPGTYELVEMPVDPLPANAVPGSLALVATFASGLLVSGCVFGRKELYARFMAPTDLQAPLL